MMGGMTVTRPTDPELDAWLTPWGYPPPGDGPITSTGPDPDHMQPVGWPHSHPCPTGEDAPTQQTSLDGQRWHWYRWACPHQQHHDQRFTRPALPLPRDVAASVWRAEHG